MSAVKDAADALSASVVALQGSVDAAVAKIVSGGAPADLQAAIDEVNASKAQVDSQKAALDAALNPPPPAG